MNQKELAHRVRKHVINMTAGGGCFLGASLSCTDLLVHLYTKVLNVNGNSLGKSNFDSPDRDYLFLSKGHDVPALYGLFAELGFIEHERLNKHLSTDDHLYWHPNTKIPGVEFHSGSLGHLLSVGAGVALDIKKQGGNNKVYVVLGDGELNEGSIWEACLVASSKGLDNLVAIVDRNKFQANMATEELSPLEPLDKKFEAFGFQTKRIDGHDFKELDDAFAKSSFAKGKPSVVIADTVRNKGLPSFEGKKDRWFVKLTDPEIQSLQVELDGGQQASIQSEPLVVR